MINKLHCLPKGAFSKSQVTLDCNVNLETVLLANKYIRGASKKVNKMRTVTVRRVIIFLNITRLPLLICLHCCLHQYKTLKAVARAIAAIILLTPAKNLNKVFRVFLVVSPLVNHYQGYV